MESYFTAAMNSRCRSFAGSAFSTPPEGGNFPTLSYANSNRIKTRMWANAQPDGRPAEHR